MSEKTILPNGLASLSLLLSAIYVWVNGRRIIDAGGVSPLAISRFKRRRKGLGSPAFDPENREGRYLFRGRPRVSDDLVRQMPRQPEVSNRIFQGQG